MFHTPYIQINRYRYHLTSIEERGNDVRNLSLVNLLVKNFLHSELQPSNQFGDWSSYEWKWTSVSNPNLGIIACLPSLPITHYLLPHSFLQNHHAYILGRYLLNHHSTFHPYFAMCLQIVCCCSPHSRIYSGSLIFYPGYHFTQRGVCYIHVHGSSSNSPSM